MNTAAATGDLRLPFAFGDGTPAAGTGVVRHADAGYPEALSTARHHGVRIPMQETSR